MLSYRVTLDVPLPLVLLVSRLPAAHRRDLGTRAGTRAPELLEADGLHAGVVPGPAGHPLAGLGLRSLPRTCRRSGSLNRTEIFTRSIIGAYWLVKWQMFAFRIGWQHRGS